VMGLTAVPCTVILSNLLCVLLCVNPLTVLNFE
jgi:hypothetical protein